MISKEQIFQLSKEVLSQEIDGESILLDIKSENYFGLNDVGSRVIEILQSGNNINNVTVILLEEFNVGREELEKDICDLFQELLNSGLIILTET